MSDLKPFYDSVRSKFGALKQNQVDGLGYLLKVTKGLSVPHRAYVLATAWHETGPASSSLHMTPRREIWGPTKAQQGYEGRKDLGNTVPGDGKRFMGRGYVQITGRANYVKASSVTGDDLVADPDLALKPDIAAAIIVDGMSRGWFTGKKLADYTSYRDMRRIVNGTDKADLIAGYAQDFEAALKALPAEPPQPVQPLPPVQPPIPQPPATAAPDLAKWVIGAAAALIAALAAWMMKG